MEKVFFGGGVFFTHTVYCIQQQNNNGKLWRQRSVSGTRWPVTVFRGR